MRNLLGAIAIVIISCGAAVAANASWFNIPWLRPVAPPVPAVTADVDEDPSNDPAKRSNSTDQKPAKRSDIVELDAVLRYLSEGGAYFVDAREENDYVAGHFRGAIHLPSSAIYANAKRVRDVVGIGDRIIVYCGGGDCEASHNVVEVLRRDYGYLDVVIYEKGWQEVDSPGAKARFADYVETGGGH